MGKKKYTASRISAGNVVFPPSIIVEEDGLTVKIPGLFNNKKKFVRYEDIFAISYDAPRIGFTKLNLTVGGTKVSVAGFYKGDCQAIMDAWKSKRQRFL